MAMTKEDVLALEKLLTASDASTKWKESELCTEFRNLTSEEIQALNLTFSPEEKRRFSVAFARFFSKEIPLSQENQDFENTLALFEAFAIFTYFSEGSYHYQEQLVRCAFDVFSDPETPVAIRRRLVDLLKQKLIKPDYLNYREYSPTVVFFANPLLFNQFGIIAMETMLQEKSWKESSDFFRQQVEKISDQLQLKTFNASVIQRGDNLEFYWVLQDPIGFFFCDQKGTIAYKVENNRTWKKLQ